MHEQVGTSRESKNEQEELVAQTSGDRRGQGQSRTNKQGQVWMSTDDQEKHEWVWMGKNEQERVPVFNFQ